MINICSIYYLFSMRVMFRSNLHSLQQCYRCSPRAQSRRGTSCLRRTCKGGYCRGGGGLGGGSAAGGDVGRQHGSQVGQDLTV